MPSIINTQLDDEDLTEFHVDPADAPGEAE